MRDEKPVVEVIIPPVGTSIRWWSHDYPHPLARWHYHPEIEFHLITSGSGYMMVGHALVPYEEGQVCLVGSKLPHNWISPLAPGQRMPGRDVVCQVDPGVVESLAAQCPEAQAFVHLLDRARHGIVLSGQAKEAARQVLLAGLVHDPVRRVADLVELLVIFAQAPRQEQRSGLTPIWTPGVQDELSERVSAVMAWVSHHFTEDISLEAAAGHAGMSPSALSRAFHQCAGITFSEFVRHVRITWACHLLITTTMPISRIPFECGYRNASNFHRRFVDHVGVTPLRYRKEYAHTASQEIRVD